MTKTNFEKIKEMSINQLATLLSSSKCKYCCVYDKKHCYSCFNGIKQWLESECEE